MTNPNRLARCFPIVLAAGAVAGALLATGLAETPPRVTANDGKSDTYHKGDKPRGVPDGYDAATNFKPSPTPADAAAEFDRIILAAAGDAKPADPIDDDAFLRRASIDLFGRIPTTGERDVFFADPPTERRGKLVDRLLSSNNRYVARFDVFFGDMLRVRTDKGFLAGNSLRVFIHEALTNNQPYDLMVRDMLTARGTLAEGAAGFLAADGAVSPINLPGVVAQELMGVRMNCAQCHDHPFDVWTQKDYYDFAAYFGRTYVYTRDKPYHVVRIGMSEQSSVRWPVKPERGKASSVLKPAWPFHLSQEPEFASRALTDRKFVHVAAARANDREVEELLRTEGRVVNGKVGEGMDADMATKAKLDATDPGRVALADVITSPRNRYFAWNLVNRLWAEFVGRGIVMPVDDFRSDNPPSNPALLNRLADEFVASGYDIKWIVSAIVRTQAYQRRHADDSDEATREKRERLFIATPRRRMNAEALYDSLVTAGHLERIKHINGTNLVETSYVVAERRPRNTGSDDKSMTMTETPAPAKATAPRAMTGYSAEEIDTQIVTMLANPDPRGSSAEMMSADADLERRASDDAMTARMNSGNAPPPSDKDTEVVYRTVTEIRDVNPFFNPAYMLPTPAPGEHMIRIFGQPSRVTLGEPRNPSPNMRQALILLNGKLVNEAARIGVLEPMARYTKDTAPVEDAVKLAYLETLSRPPSEKELAAGKALIAAADNRADGIADLRWALLNSLEFRFIP